MTDNPGPSFESNLVLLRASRLEALVPQLMDLLAQTCPDDVLAPQTVVAAHPGMKQWLTGAMARHAGTAGIVANLDVLLPGAWLAQAANDLVGASAASAPAWQREALRWAIHAALQPDATVPGLADPRVARYLAADAAGEAERERRRFQLAHHLAGVFSQYLVYRADWLRAWESGAAQHATTGLTDAASIGLERELLAPLWRHLAAHLGPHRAGLLERMLRALAGAPGRLAPVHVFGVSHLPPGEQQVLQAWARHAPVFLYLPDPCREYWGGLSARVEHRDSARKSAAQDLGALRQWHEQESDRIAAADGGDWLDHAQTHPLLARWGRLGQHFYAELAGWNTLADIRDHNDVAESEPTTRLLRMQESIRRLQHELLDDRAPFPRPHPEDTATAHDAAIQAWWQPRRSDASLRVHACHTRLRELDVLHDALLDAVAAGIAPGNIVVMAPDITAYAGLLPSVFGAAGDGRERLLPWHLADVPLKRSHRLFSTFARLLDWGHSRATLPDVADLLAVPEIAAALGLEPGQHDALLNWLAESGAAWALDANHRAQLGVPATHQHTLAWGMDRLLAGYVMADLPPSEHDPAVTLPDASVLLPLGGVQGPDSAALGALDRLLLHLHAWRELADARHPAQHWAQRLREHLDGLLKIDPDDPRAAAALATLHGLIARLGSEPEQAGENPTLHFSVVRDILLDALEGVSERQRFLMGGITFCGMVPQRAIPFDMVCVLGLDDGQFPRRRRDGGIDLMTRLRRLGDRDTRSDDRWLFLETLMSARQRLHLSWLGQGVRDGKPRSPAAPLAELLFELDRGAAVQDIEIETEPRARPWLVRHPLQAFDARYFDGHDPALFSYSPELAGMHGDGQSAMPPFLAGEPDAPETLPASVSLPALTRFWKAPAEELLKHRLRLDLSALEGTSLPESEPLDPQLERIHAIARRVFFQHALPLGVQADGTPNWTAAQLPAWIKHGGLLPPGDLAQIAWEPQARAVLALLQEAHLQDVPAQDGQSIQIDVSVPNPQSSEPPLQLHGQVHNVFAREHSWQLVHPLPRPSTDEKPALSSASNLDLGARLVLFIQWAALRLHSVQTQADEPRLPAIRIALLADGHNTWIQHLSQWDDVFIHARPKLRAQMQTTLQTALTQLCLHWWQAGSRPPLYFPATSQAALDAQQKASDSNMDNTSHLRAIAKAAEKRFESGYMHTGERDYAPGWTRILASGLAFDPHGATPDADMLKELLDYASTLQELIQLPLPPEAS